IRELENVNDSVEEICDRMQHYSARLFGHIANYGVRMVGMVRQSGGLADFRFSLDPIYDDEGRTTRISGLSMMNPNSVTVEAGDLGGLVPNPVTRELLADEWQHFGNTLQKILPSDIPQLLETAAIRMMRRAPSDAIGYAEYDDELYQDFLRRAGKRDP